MCHADRCVLECSSEARLADAKRFFCAAAIVDETRVLKCYCTLIRSHRKQKLVKLGGKVFATARRSNQTGFGIDPNRNDNTTAWFRVAANVRNDLHTCKLAHGCAVALQPFRKYFPCIAARDFEFGPSVRRTQTHKSEIEVQRSDQHVAKPGGYVRRFSPNPRRRNGQQRYEISERCSQPEDLGLVTYRHLVFRGGAIAE